MKFSLFISSVQSEFAEMRQMLARYIRQDALLGKFFDPFLFEEAPACNQSAQSVYLEEVRNCDVYLALLGRSFGCEVRPGVSATECEYDLAVELSKPRLVFVQEVAERESDEQLNSPEFRPNPATFHALIWRKCQMAPKGVHEENHDKAYDGHKSGICKAHDGHMSMRERIIVVLSDETLSRKEIASVLNVSWNSGGVKKPLDTLIADGIVGMTIPGTPKSRLQKYRLTEKGLALKATFLGSLPRVHISPSGK